MGAGARDRRAARARRPARTGRRGRGGRWLRRGRGGGKSGRGRAGGPRDRGAVEADFERVFLLFPVLKERGSQPGGTLSGGEQQMLAIGRGLMLRPEPLMLGEASMGVSPLVPHRVF